MSPSARPRSNPLRRCEHNSGASSGPVLSRALSTPPTRSSTTLVRADGATLVQRLVDLGYRPARECAALRRDPITTSATACPVHPTRDHRSRKSEFSRTASRSDAMAARSEKKVSSSGCARQRTVSNRCLGKERTRSATVAASIPTSFALASTKTSDQWNALWVPIAQRSAMSLLSNSVYGERYHRSDRTVLWRRRACSGLHSAGGTGSPRSRCRIRA